MKARKIMDSITLKDLAVFYNVGVPEDERAQPQQLQVTVELALDFGRAAVGDDITQTIDYYAVSRRIIGFGHERSWKLIETVAVDLAGMILEEFRATAVTVEVKKFVIPEAKYVAVRVTRACN